MAENLLFMHIATITTIVLRHQAMNQNFGIPAVLSICFFINSDNLDMHTLNNLKDFAINSIEPHFVRGDGKYPVKHHLYSHISFIIITRNKPSYEVEEAIKNITWNKSYMFSAKGYCNLKMVCVTPREYSVIANENAKDIKDFLMDILLHIDHYED